MKKRTIVLAIAKLGLVTALQAQPRPEGNSNGSQVTGPPIGGSNGGSAPIGGGLFILLAMGAGYAGRKLYITHKEETL
jgi:hypothetical protein